VNKLPFVVCLLTTLASAQGTDAGFPTGCKVEPTDGGVTASCGDMSGAAWLSTSFLKLEQVAQAANPTAKVTVSNTAVDNGEMIGSTRFDSDAKVGWAQVVREPKGVVRGVYCLSALTKEEAGGATMRNEKARPRCEALTRALLATKLERATPTLTPSRVSISTNREVLIDKSLPAAPPGCAHKGTPVSAVSCADSELRFSMAPAVYAQMMKQLRRSAETTPCAVVGTTTTCYVNRSSSADGGATKWMLSAETEMLPVSIAWVCLSDTDPRQSIPAACVSAFKLGSDVAKTPAK
jgi:hypothetical protein